MNLRTIPRLAVNGWLTAAQWPLHRTAEALGRRNGQATSGPELLVDRADAAVRDAVGRVTLDRELREDAARRRTAAGERERAVRLRAQAQERRSEGEEKLQEGQQRAEQQRRTAAERA